MNKNFIMLAAAVVLLSACAEKDTFKDAAQEQKADQALSFSAYADKVTRGTNSTALQDFYTVFGVYGWKTVAKTDGSGYENQPVFVNIPNEYFTADQQGDVVYNASGEKPSKEWALADPFNGAWYYKDVRYWDKMATSYQFFAIAPYDKSETPVYAVTPSAPNATDAEKNNNFSIYSESSKYDISTEYNLARTNLAANPVSETEAPKSELTYSGFKKDYMIAEKKYATPKGSVTTTDVQLIFHHILTKLNVKIQKSDNYKAQQVLKVNELKIANLAKEGYFVYKTNMTTNGWTTSGTYDIDIDTEYALANDATNYDQYYWIETLIFPQTSICKLPGAQPKADGLTNLYLYIQYQIGTDVFNVYYDLAYIFDSTLAPTAATLYEASDDEVVEGTKEIGDPKTYNNDGGEFEFKQGSQYNLTITVGPDPIHFDAEVFEWTTETERTISAN